MPSAKDICKSGLKKGPDDHGEDHAAAAVDAMGGEEASQPRNILNGGET